MASGPKKRASPGRIEVDRTQKPAPLRSADEVAAYLAISVLGVYRRLREGRLRGHKVGGQWRISDGAVRQFLEDSIRVPKGGNSSK